METVKKMDVVEHVMSRAKDFGGGKTFEVKSEFDEAQISSVSVCGHAQLRADDPRLVLDLELMALRQEMDDMRSSDNPFDDKATAHLAELERKISETDQSLKEVRAKNRTVVFKTTTTGLDRHGTVVKTQGIDTDTYTRNPVVGWAHALYGGLFTTPDIEDVIGKCVGIRKGMSSMEQDIEFAPVDVNPKGDRAYRMVLGRFLQATSIGFIPKEIVIELHDEREVPVITKCELLEVSVVAIPSNPEVESFVREMATRMANATSSIRYGDFEFRGPLAERMIKQISASELEQKETPPAEAADLGVSGVTAEMLRRVMREWALRMALRHGRRVC